MSCGAGNHKPVQIKHGKGYPGHSGIENFTSILCRTIGTAGNLRYGRQMVYHEERWKLETGVHAVYAGWDNAMARVVRALDTMIGVGPITTTMSATPEHPGETLESSTIQLYLTMSTHFSWPVYLIGTVRH